MENILLDNDEITIYQAPHTEGGHYFCFNKKYKITINLSKPGGINTPSGHTDSDDNLIAGMPYTKI